MAKEVASIHLEHPTIAAILERDLRAATLVPTMKKPLDVFAEGLLAKH
jgi:hypothetical protein